MFHFGLHGGGGSWLKEQNRKFLESLVFMKVVLKQVILDVPKYATASLIAINIMWLMFTFLYSGEEILMLVRYISECFEPYE